MANTSFFSALFAPRIVSARASYAATISAGVAGGRPWARALGGAVISAVASTPHAITRFTASSLFIDDLLCRGRQPRSSDLRQLGQRGPPFRVLEPQGVEVGAHFVGREARAQGLDPGGQPGRVGRGIARV